MTRVEAVARALDQSDCWGTYDEVLRTGVRPSESLLASLEKSKERAQRAIEANDAWLTEHESALAEGIRVNLSSCSPASIASLVLKEIRQLG